MEKLATKPKTKYIKIKTLKKGMSQMFNESAKVVPFTKLKVVNEKDIEILSSLESNSKIKLSGITKGHGFTGAMKRWGFSGGPKTHGQSDKYRSAGSIGTQGQGRVIPGKKMAGHVGTNKVTVKARFLDMNKDEGFVRIKGAVPGSFHSEVILYLPKDN